MSFAWVWVPCGMRDSCSSVSIWQGTFSKAHLAGHRAMLQETLQPVPHSLCSAPSCLLCQQVQQCSIHNACALLERCLTCNTPLWDAGDCLTMLVKPKAPACLSTHLALLQLCHVSNGSCADFALSVSCFNHCPAER